SWHYSSGGAFSFVPLLNTSVPYSELQFGDFNGDGQTDVLAALPQNDGRLQVVDWPGGLGAPHSLGFVAAPAPALRVGDFDGDGRTDLALVGGLGATLAIVTARSNGNGSFTLGSPQLFPGEANWGIFNPLVGDFNHDGRDDLALTTVCNTVSLLAGSCT